MEGEERRREKRRRRRRSSSNSNIEETGEADELPLEATWHIVDLTELFIVKMLNLC